MYKPACIYEHQCWSRTQISLFHNHNISLAKHGRDAKPATHPLAPLRMVQRLYISFCLPQKRYKKAQINECNCAASTSHMPCTHPAHTHTYTTNRLAFRSPVKVTGWISNSVAFPVASTTCPLAVSVLRITRSTGLSSQITYLTVHLLII